MQVRTTLNSSGYFPGDDLFCSIVCATRDSSQSKSSILWMSAQLYGYIEFDSHWRFPNTQQDPHKNSRRLSSTPPQVGIAKNDHYRCLFVTQAVILGCDLPVTSDHPQYCQ